jgi:hypothetical protein
VPCIPPYDRWKCIDLGRGPRTSHKTLIFRPYGAAMRAYLLTIAIAMLVAACGGGGSGSENLLPTGSERVDLNADDFVQQIDHPYWPMAPGSKWVFTATDFKGNTERIEITVTNRKKRIQGIEATVVHDVVTENGELIEDTFDWFAQDKDGNVWYLGEDTTEFENGKPVSKKGSWEAGVKGAQAGIILPGKPEVGMTFREEYLEGEAEDRGEILSLDERVQVAAGSYDNVLMTKDWTRLEPTLLEHKFYARGVGPVLVLGISGSRFWEELVSVTNAS